MTYKARKERKRSYGGKAEGPEHQYNAQGSPEDREEHAKSDGFKRGGEVEKKRKAGGHVEGEKAKHHLAKRARGGHVPKRARGGSPMSSGHRLSAPGNQKGSPGEQAPTEP